MSKGTAQYKNLHYEAGDKPAFLRRMLNGTAPPSSDPDGIGRVPIPERPANDNYEDPLSDEEGEEAPQVVVLNQGKHLSQAQVNALKRNDGIDPQEEIGSASVACEKVPQRDSASRSLSFSSQPGRQGPSAKRKSAVKDTPSIVKKSKIGDDATKPKPKVSRPKKKGPLSFEAE